MERIEVSPLERCALLRALVAGQEEGAWELLPEEGTVLPGLVRKLGGSWEKGDYIGMPDGCGD